MKFFIKKEVILKPLSKLSNYLPFSTQNPIFSNVLISLKKDVLLFVITDLNVEISFTTSVLKQNIISCGVITVNIRKLYTLCKTFPKNSDLLFFLYNKRLKISYLSSVFYLSTITPSNFPFFDKNFKVKNKLIISSFLLKKIISSVCFAMSNQNIHHFLNGMLIENNKFCFFVTTDSYRMSVYQLKPKYFIIKKKHNFCFILPKKLVFELFKFCLFIKHDEQILFKISVNKIQICINKYIIYSNLINGTFPNFNVIINIKDYYFVDFDGLIFKNAIIRSSIIVDDTFNYVTFVLKKNILKILTNNFNNDESVEKIIINNNINLKITFNIRYILDIINLIKESSFIRFYFKDKFSIVKFVDLKNIYINHMVMPIKI